jgi:hypothetical protein
LHHVNVDKPPGSRAFLADADPGKPGNHSSANNLHRLTANAAYIKRHS